MLINPIQHIKFSIFHVILIINFLLTGCGTHLHRPDDAQLARTASIAFKDVKLEASIKMELIAASEILDSEIAAIRRQSNARRDRVLSAVIGEEKSGDAWNNLINYTRSRLEELLGTEIQSNDLDLWLASQNNTGQRYETVRQSYLQYDQNRKHDDPRIIRIGTLLSEQDANNLQDPLKTIYSAYLESLDKYNITRKNSATPPTTQGIIGGIVASRNAQEKKLSDASDAARIVKTELDKIKTERNEKIIESQTPGKKADEISKALKEITDKTDKMISILESLLRTANDGLSGVQKKIIALEEIREQVTEILPRVADAVAGQTPPPEDSEKIKILESITAIRKGIGGIAYPRISDLILESERLRIELERLRGLIALEEERKIMLNLQLTALGREINSLRYAEQRVKSAKAAKTKAEMQALTIESFAYLAESWSNGRTSAEEIDFLIAGIDHRAALKNSAAALAQWSNLIGVPLSQLVAYHESGIRSEDLANLISAAGFSAIAPGLY